MNKQNFRKSQHEKGMATLVIIMLLLFVATMVTLYTANTTVREQQVSANQYRADQALSAANAGLDYAIAYFFKYAGPDAINAAVAVSDPDYLKGDGFIDELTVPTLSGDGQEVFADVWITDAGTTDTTDRFRHLVADAAFNGPHTITSVGFSDDRTATRTIEVELDAFGIVPGGGLPGFPLIAKDIADNGGNFSIINRFSNATIWTGADTDKLGSAETYVADPFNLPTTPEEFVDITGSPDPDLVLHASYSKAGLNSDVIENDDNLKNMEPDQFFENFMLENKERIEAYALTTKQRFESGSITWNELVGLRGLVWVEVPEGDTWTPSGSMEKIGTDMYPLTLIVNGNFKTTGGGAPAIRIVGLLYVTGNWDGSGNFAIQGSCIVEGDVANTGSPTIVYDELLFDGSKGSPPGGIVAVDPGTWKDW